jgi:hypothetical protein
VVVTSYKQELGRIARHTQKVREVHIFWKDDAYMFLHEGVDKIGRLTSLAPSNKTLHERLAQACIKETLSICRPGSFVRSEYAF